MANDKLANAKDAKKDEFYTQYEDIQNEINAYLEYDNNTFRGKTVLLPCDDPEWSNFTRYFAQNFDTLGLKKLISTSYAINSKIKKYGDIGYQFSLFDSEDEKLDEEKERQKGKIFILERDIDDSGNINIDDLEWSYLDGDGDFLSDEVKALRDEADVIVTNPPFSLFKDFIPWIMEANKKFIIVGNLNSITYKEIFPLLMQNKIWLGKGFKGMAGHFINKMYEDYATSGNHKKGMIRVSGVIWYTNLEHGRRHQPISLMSMKDNIKYSKHKEIRGHEYPKYETLDGIEVKFTDAIPNDYKGIMGVPKSFMEQYCPEQFEILGYEREDENVKCGIKTMPEQFLNDYRSQGGTGHYTKGMKMLCFYNSDGEAKVPFSKILIRYTDNWIKSHPEDFERGENE